MLEPSHTVKLAGTAGAAGLGFTVTAVAAKVELHPFTTTITE